jgi:hypothetical protein
MKILAAIGFASVTLMASASGAMAVKSSTVTGAAIGAGAGAVVAGPPGAVVGGVAGAVIGGPSVPRAHRHCWVSHGVRHCR